MNKNENVLWEMFHTHSTLLEIIPQRALVHNTTEFVDAFGFELGKDAPPVGVNLHGRWPGVQRVRYVQNLLLVLWLRGNRRRCDS